MFHKVPSKFIVSLFAISSLVTMSACSSNNGSSSAPVTPSGSGGTSGSTPYVMTGQTDTNFGTAGFAINPVTTTNSYGVGVVAQSTGSLVFLFQAPVIPATGYYLTRFNTDGSVDTSFGNSGQLTLSCTTFIINTCTPTNILVQNDDKIILVANFSVFIPIPTSGFEAIRYNSNGSLDTTYGTNGVVTVSSSSSTSAFIDPTTDNLVVAGSNGSGIFIERFLPTGSIDTSFGSTGILALTSIPTLVGTPSLTTALYDSVNGEYLASGTDSTAVLAGQITSSGSLDTNFGTSGGLGFAGIGAITSLAVQADGSILLGAVSSGTTLQVTRLLSNGQVDTSFGTSGSILITTGALNSAAVESLFVDGVGNILVLANVTSTVPPAINPTSSSIIFRFTSGGSVDGTFGTSGSLALSDWIYGSILNATNGKLDLAVTDASGAEVTQIE